MFENQFTSNIREYFIDLYKFFRSQLKQVNLVLNGKDSNFQIFLKTKPDPRLVDPVKLHANKMYLKK
jgi:hypothetical protein